MWVEQCHQGQKAIVRNPQDAHIAVCLGHVFYEPVDGVVGIGGMVNGSRIAGAIEGPIHHIVAL